MLAWRPDGLQNTALSHPEDELCMTIFAIPKGSEHECLISWPRKANVLMLKPRRQNFAKPRHFAFARSAEGTCKWFWSDATNTFHNLSLLKHS